MVPIDRDHIRTGLLKKGFVEGGGDHDFYHLIVDGKRRNVFTKLSRASKYKTLSDHLVAAISKQLGLTKKELGQFLDCPLEFREYVNMLRDRKRIRP